MSMMWPRVYLPLLALASGVLLWVLQSKLIVAPFLMLLAPPFWLAMAIGIVLTLRYNFLVGVIAAIVVDLVLMLILVNLAMTPEVLGHTLYAPVLPLAILQLVAAPFQLRGQGGRAPKTAEIVE